jgi:hypothetical protein
MIITKSELRKILNEEISEALSEEEAPQAQKLPQTVAVTLERMRAMLTTQMQQLDDYTELIPFFEGVLSMIEELNEKDFTQSEKIRTYLDFATRFRNRSRDVQRQGAQAASGEGEDLR